MFSKVLFSSNKMSKLTLILLCKIGYAIKDAYLLRSDKSAETTDTDIYPTMVCHIVICRTMVLISFITTKRLFIALTY